MSLILVGVLFPGLSPLATSVVLGQFDHLLEGVYNPHGHVREGFSRLGYLRWGHSSFMWEGELPGLGSLDE